MTLLAAILPTLKDKLGVEETKRKSERQDERDCVYMTPLDHVQSQVWIPWNVEIPSWLEFYFCHVRSENPLPRFSLGGMRAEVKYRVYLCQ